MAPTRILERRPTGCSGNQIVYEYICDDGKKYRGIKELAAAVPNASYSGIVARMLKLGYRDPQVLTGIVRKKAEMDTRVCEECGKQFTCLARVSQRYCSHRCGTRHRKAEGNEEWHKLSTKPRNQNIILGRDSVPEWLSKVYERKIANLIIPEEWR